MRDEWGSREPFGATQIWSMLYQSRVCDASRRIDNASFRSITRCELVYKVVEQPPSRIGDSYNSHKKRNDAKEFLFSLCVFFYPIYVFTFSQPFWQSEWIRNGGKNYATRGRAEQTSVEWAGWRWCGGGSGGKCCEAEMKLSEICSRPANMELINLIC